MYSSACGLSLCAVSLPSRSLVPFQSLISLSSPDGAAVFFTSHTHPTSFAKLRSYILHRLFAQPSSALPASSAPAPLAGAAPPASSRSFPFPYRANVVDREEFVVPAGWDSRGKIKIHKERFDAEGLAKGWESDLEVEREKLAGKESAEDEPRLDEEGKPVVGALLQFEHMLPNEEQDRRVSRHAVALSFMAYRFLF